MVGQHLERTDVLALNCSGREWASTTLPTRVRWAHKGSTTTTRAPPSRRESVPANPRPRASPPV